MTARLKVSLAGPWTLAADLELPRGGPVLGDPGAVHDLGRVTGRDGARAPRRGAAGGCRRRSWYSSSTSRRCRRCLPARSAPRAGSVHIGRRSRRPRRRCSRAAIEAAGDVPVVVHCCAADAPLRLLSDAGAAAVSFDRGHGAASTETPSASSVEAGVALWLGVVPVAGAGRSRRLRARSPTRCGGCGTSSASPPEQLPERGHHHADLRAGGRLAGLGALRLPVSRQAARTARRGARRDAACDARKRRPRTRPPRRHRELSQEVEDLAYRYYVLTQPTVADAEYDAKMRELEAIEDGAPGAAHAGLPDAEGHGVAVHRLRRGPPPRAAALARQRVQRRRVRRLGRARHPRGAGAGAGCAS